MGPRLFLLFSFLLLPTLAAWGKEASIAPLGQAIWKITYTLYLDNGAAGTSEVELKVPFLPDDYPFQEVLSRQVPLHPRRIEKDSYGNEWGTWRLKVLPGEQAFMTFSYKVVTRHIRCMDHSHVAAPDDGPMQGIIPGFRPNPVKPLESVNNRAKAVSDGEKSLYYRALKIYDYLLTHYSFNPHGKKYGVLEALDKKTIQCSDAALLFSELAKASGIPSRCTGGLYVTQGNDTYTTFHSWAEVVLPEIGRGAVDPTLGRFNATQRLRCFLERRSNYITFWKGSEAPFSILYLKGNSHTAPLRFSVTAVKLSGESFRTAPVNYERGKKEKGAPQGFPPVHSNRFGSREAQEYFALGEKEREKRHYSQAITAFERAENGGFTCPALYNARMCLFAETKEISRFEAALNMSLSLDDRQGDVYERALHFYMDLEMWSPLIELAGRGKKRLPSSGLFPALEGYAHMSLGNYERALELINEAIALEPSMGWNHCIRGWILIKKGDKAGAQKEIESGIKLRTGVDNPVFFRNLLKAH